MLKIAIISDHASPLGAPGSIGCGGQNVHVAHLACRLAQGGADGFPDERLAIERTLMRGRMDSDATPTREPTLGGTA